MKRFMYAGAMLCAMALMTGCSEEEQMAGQAQSGNFSVTATTGVDTRTTVDGYTVHWSENDKIYVYGEGVNATLDLTDGKDTNKGTFTGTIKGDATALKYAVYPVPTIAEGSKSISFPATYTYPYNSNSPMYATFGNDKSSLSFGHLCGMMRLTINGIPTDGEKTLTLTSESNIAGSAALTETDDKLSLSAISSGEGKSITVTIPEGTTGTTFDMPLPAGTYTNGIKVGLTVDGKECIAESTTNIDIKVGNMLEMATLTYININGETPTLAQPVATVDEANKALEEGKNSVAIAAVAATGSDITITVPPTADKAPTTVAINALQTGENKLVIKAKENETVNQDINLFLGAATSDSGTGQPKININIETGESHVTIAPTNKTNGAIEIETANVLTGETTFVIEKGVTVNKLTVNGGNVRVNAGATIEAIEKGSENNASVIFLYTEEGAIIPGSLDECFIVVNAAVHDLKKALNNGESYKLTVNNASIVGQSLNVPAGKTATLDLNGYTLIADNSTTGRIMVYGTFTLKDSSTGKAGKIVANSDYEKGIYDGALIEIAGEQASMTMESGNISAVRPDNAMDYGQFGITVSKGGDFTMTGGKIEAGWYAVCGNGNFKTENSIINIKGGELVSTADYALYLPQSGTTTISGGTVYGVAGGIAIQRGTLNVEGTALITSKGTGDTGDSSDGTGNLGCAAINANARYGDCTINIKGGTLTAESEALITEGTNYTATINVTGGTFSDPSMLKYMKDNANVNIKLSADKECPGFKTTKGQTLTMNLGGKILALTDPAVGSPGTETNSCQLLEGSTVTIKNGTLKSENTEIMIQNYSNLTLDGMTVIGENAKYVVSNNCGNIQINNTTITAGNGDNQFAFDVCGYAKYTSGVEVTVSGKSVIDGKVEISKSANNTQTMKLNITGGTFKGDLKVDSSVTEEEAKGIISISGNPTFEGSGWNDYKSTAGQ